MNLKARLMAPLLLVLLIATSAMMWHSGGAAKIRRPIRC
jgi:hypothetical protein